MSMLTTYREAKTAWTQSLSEFSEAQDLLARCLSELSEAQDLVARTVNKCVTLGNKVNATTRICSLPFELKVDIFLLARYETNPLILGAVCHDWREIIWNGPERLWDTINLSVIPESFNTQVTLLHEWLERSGKSNLFINLRIEESDCEHCPDFSQFLWRLFDHAHRWEHFHLITPLDIFVYVFGDKEAKYLPALRTLYLEFNSGYSVPEGEFVRYFADAPILSKIDIEKTQGFGLCIRL